MGRDDQIRAYVAGGATYSRAAARFSLSRQRIWQIAHERVGPRRAGRRDGYRIPGKPTDAAILRELRRHPAVSKDEWGDRLGISASGVAWRFGSWSAAKAAAQEGREK